LAKPAIKKISGQTQEGNKRQEIACRKIPQRSEIVLEPKDDKGDIEEQLKKSDPLLRRAGRVAPSAVPTPPRTKA